MSIGFGPALDAEVSYRQQQARSDFRPRWRRGQRRGAQPAVDQHTAPDPVRSSLREPVLIPAQPTRQRGGGNIESVERIYSDVA